MMWIALTLLFALLSLVLYMANRELDKELKLKDIIIDNLIIKGYHDKHK